MVSRAVIKLETVRLKLLLILMRDFSYNLMELLGDKFSFMERIQEINAKLTEGQIVNPS